VNLENFQLIVSRNLCPIKFIIGKYLCTRLVPKLGKKIQFTSAELGIRGGVEGLDLEVGD